MNWTKEQPQIEGWYWYRSPRLSRPTIVRVFRYKVPADSRWLMSFVGDNSEIELPHGADWFGPLQEPK